LQTLLPEGCNGANEIKTKQSRNLHALWDGLLGNDDGFQACHNQAVKISADEKLAAIGLESAKSLGTVELWDQSHEFAKSFVYADEVRAHLQRLDAAGETEVALIDLTETYLKQAGRVAEEQAARAGWRLCAIISKIGAPL
jgi:hypothetical protein